MATLAAAGTATALTTSESDHTTLFTSLLNDGKLAPHKCNAGAIQRRDFGPTDQDYPQLSREISPYSKADPLTPQELHDMCLHELSRVRDYFGARPVYWAPSGGDDGSVEANDQGTSSQLIRSLTVPDIALRDAVASFPSETLDQICLEAGFDAPKHTLHRTHKICTVFSENALIPLQHNSEGATTTTVLAGSMIWIIWPPTAHNLNVLQAAYEAFAPDCNEAALDVTHNLEGGIVLTQIEGEALRIPPYCPMMGLSLHISVLATNSTTTVSNFIAMLQKAPLLKAWFRTEIDGKRKQTEFNNRLLKWLDLLLNGEMDLDTKQLDRTLKLQLSCDGPLRNLLNIWDGIKDDIAGLLGPADAKVLADIWADFLIESRGRECSICGVTIRNKMRLMRGHFVERHWVGDMGKKRMDSAGFEDEGDARGDLFMPNVVATVDGMDKAGMRMEVE